MGRERHVVNEKWDILEQQEENKRQRNAQRAKKSWSNISISNWLSIPCWGPWFSPWKWRGPLRSLAASLLLAPNFRHSRDHRRKEEDDESWKREKKNSKQKNSIDDRYVCILFFIFLSFSLSFSASRAQRKLISAVRQTNPVESSVYIHTLTQRNIFSVRFSRWLAHRISAWDPCLADFSDHCFALSHRPHSPLFLLSTFKKISSIHQTNKIIKSETKLGFVLFCLLFFSVFLL